MNTQTAMTKTPTFADNKEEALAFYCEFGYIIEPDMFTLAECEELIRAAENLPAFREGSFAPAMNPHRIGSIFLKALRNPKIVKIMELLVNGKVSGLQTEFFYGKPGTPGFSMHQDNYFVEAPIGAFASAWTPMVDVTPERGGLIIFPKSHQAGPLPVVPTGKARDGAQDPNATREEVVLPPQYEPLHISVPRGATVFIHGHLVHSSNQNRSDVFRRVLLCTYIRSGETFRPGNTAKRTEVELYS